jgi:hypothetical protein
LVVAMRQETIATHRHIAAESLRMALQQFLCGFGRVDKEIYSAVAQRFPEKSQQNSVEVATNFQ